MSHCVTLFPVNERMKKGYVGSWVEVIVHNVREVSAGACRVSHIVRNVSLQSGSRNKLWCSVPCFLFIQSGTPACEKVLPTLRVGLLPSIKPL